ncbi:uncharacterized protein LOC129951837 [Eupeodes corollae]|uniref:uncharacterized protein LOC129951837 n=1 Tax=Eupeodes corollae TaxID=290404 RepID=UPI00249102D8|nr:uncharacterized protein LOC129951837 [Eupeodes corollae]
MDIRVCFSLKNLSASAIDFYKCALQENSDPSSSIAPFVATPNGNEIFEIIEENFDELHKPEILVGVLKILNLTIQQSSTGTCRSMSQTLKNLLTQHASHEPDYWIALQLLKQFLTSLPSDFKIPEELVDEIIKPNESVRVQNQLAICICLLVDKFQRTSLLQIIWQEILMKKSPNLLVSCIDPLIAKHRIHLSSEFWRLIETFLLTDSNRKAAIFSIRKVLTFICSTDEEIYVKRYFVWPGEQLLASWLTYLTILENLEEKQSHLILPALQLIESVRLGEDTPWIRIVLQQMLRHKNNLVLRWTVNYLFDKFFELVLANGILEDFFHATNNTWLYNEKDACRLPHFKIDEQDHFLKVFAEIPWKSVPMHAWLMEMKQRVVWNDVKCKTVITTAARIRQLQNRSIRSHSREYFVSIFKSKIEQMALDEFINFLDAFYSSSDTLTPELQSLLMTKIEESPKPHITFNLFMLLRNQHLSKNHQMLLLEKLHTLKQSDHKWFSVLVVFFFENSAFKNEFCYECYGLMDFENNLANVSLQEQTSEFVKKLSWDDGSKGVIRELTVDWYSTRCGEIKKSDFEDLLHTGGIRTLLNLTNQAKRNFPLDEAMMNSVIAELKTWTKRMADTFELVRNIIDSCRLFQADLFCKYLNEILDIDVSNSRLAFNVFKTCLEMCTFQDTGERKLLIRGLLFGEPLTGDARLEYDYAVRLNLPGLETESAYTIREMCLKHLKDLDADSQKFLKKYLIEQSKNMSIRKPRYFENSKQHRLKLRIVQALTILNYQLPHWDDYYLYAVLQENNQTNVTYMYEFLVATTISEEELFHQMQNLPQNSTSCQSSLFAISYLFSVHHECGNGVVSKLITLLLPWTMGANFNTRLHAQIAVYHLLKRFKIPEFAYLQVAIEKGLTESPNAIEKLNTDVRFNYPEKLPFLNNAEPVLYVTVVPEDERLSSSLDYLSFFDSLKEARRIQLLKKEPSKEQETNVVVVGDVQRKMNPEIDSYDFTSSSGSKERQVHDFDMIVVASLIDKLPNLGGIARTCEVLGIRELVLDSEKHTQNKEFKNLSMTAENWINITEVKPKALREFLLTKQIEGYEIVGAEQTSNSVNFMEFKFPRKCVLLLGHEKEGIPADLIALLDYAVEIPQFGMVRSLNVHVTGALFMYEYCKQRLTVLEK